MRRGKYHTIIDEYYYPKKALQQLYQEELKPLVVQYGKKMGWGPERRQAWTPGINAVDPTLSPYDSVEYLTDFSPIKEIYQKFNIKDLHPDDFDVLVYNKEYEFPPHVDYKQNAVIMMPIAPKNPTPIDFYTIPGLKLEKYTKFRDLDKKKYWDYTYYYSTVHPTLNNGLCIHGVGPLPPQETRVFLRIKVIKETYEDILNKLEEGVFLQ